MIDLFWIAVCLIGWGILAACWLIDDQVDVIERLRSELNELSRVAAHMEDSRPISVGDRETDPISMEIAYFCGTDQVVLHAVHPLPNDMLVQCDVVPSGVFGLSVLDAGTQIAWTKGTFDRHHRRCLSVGLADAMHIEKITDAVRRYNEAFHRSKGVEDAGVKQEGRRADRDRGNGSDTGSDHDHRSPDPRGQGATRD
jgi:hypothetical protein